LERYRYRRCLSSKYLRNRYSWLYQSEEIAYNDFNGRWRAGFNIQNIGPKISYDNDQINTNFIPANLKFGTGFDFILDDYNKVGLNVEFKVISANASSGLQWL
jgi:hypothetical protein